MSSNNINLSSLKLVRDELLTTIEASAAKLEQFVADRDNGDLLQGCIDGIKQISGTLSVVQLKGADLLAQEILALAQEITTGVNSEADDYISTLTSSFFILPRYLEYVQQTKRNLPVLLVPAINEMRQVRIIITGRICFKIISPASPVFFFIKVRVRTFIVKICRVETLEQVSIFITKS